MARVLIAPDSFKGSASATEVAAALKEGWLSTRPADDVVTVPMADGGEGTLDAFESAFVGSKRMPVAVSGPDGRPVHAEWLLLPDGAGLVELANTSGITLVQHLDPLGAHTRGFGQAISAALDFGVHRLYLALGGSCSTDGGTGMLRELGARFLNADGDEIGDGGGALTQLDAVDLTELAPLPAGGCIALTDVTNPLCGSTGAAFVFGPQKGAGVDDIDLLEHAMSLLASRMPADATAAGSGAAGGTGFGLLAWGARIEIGSSAVAGALELGAKLAEADLVVSGEGRFDRQSLDGKVLSYFISECAEREVPLALVAGSIQAPVTQFEGAVSLSTVAGSAAAAMSEPQRWLRAAGAELARSYELGS